MASQPHSTSVTCGCALDGFCAACHRRRAIKSGAVAPANRTLRLADPSSTQLGEVVAPHTTGLPAAGGHRSGNRMGARDCDIHRDRSCDGVVGEDAQDCLGVLASRRRWHAAGVRLLSSVPQALPQGCDTYPSPVVGQPPATSLGRTPPPYRNLTVAPGVAASEGQRVPFFGEHKSVDVQQHRIALILAVRRQNAVVALNPPSRA